MWNLRSCLLSLKLYCDQIPQNQKPKEVWTSKVIQSRADLGLEATDPTCHSYFYRPFLAALLSLNP